MTKQMKVVWSERFRLVVALTTLVLGWHALNVLDERMSHEPSSGRVRKISEFEAAFIAANQPRLEVGGVRVASL